MKTRIIYIALLSGILFTTCGKEFLERDPLVGSTEVNFYQTPEDAEAATIACYNPLQQEVTNIQGTSQLAPHFRWYFGDICSDDSFKGGSGDGDEPELFQFENFQGSASSKLVLGEWQAAYRAIAYCNISLDKIPAIEMDEEIKARYIAEAKFIRAYSYFTLVTMFGGVPIVTEPLAPSEYQQGSATASEVWDLIIKDLNEARADLPKKSELSVSELGRATWGAATGFLAKSYMFRGDFGNAFDYAEEVINSLEYILDPNYANIFTLAGENGPGSIFEIQYMNASGGNWGNQLEGTFTNIFTRARGNFNGFGFNIPTQDFVDAFEAGDPRLSASVFQEGDVMGDRGVFTLDATGFPHLYYAKKSFSNAADDAPFGDNAPNGASNDRVLRYADVLLIAAESAYHNNDELSARNYVNEVRERARGGNNSVLPDIAPFVTGENLLDAIHNERRVELGLEGHRFFDLARRGELVETMSNLGFTSVSDNNALFPIPTAEITLSGGLITQNPGY